jgi:hypothetical protein
MEERTAKRAKISVDESATEVLVDESATEVVAVPTILSEAPAPAAKVMAMCRRCHSRFDKLTNASASCRHHPEEFSGETKQRWQEAGPCWRAATVVAPRKR